MNELVGSIGIIMIIGVVVYGIYIIGKPHEFVIKK